LTQVALAKKLGRPQSFVSKFERGERRLDVIEFLDVARALKVDPAQIIANLERR
jgi:transcriptional regulator with XRE-family HTH domain